MNIENTEQNRKKILTSVINEIERDCANPENFSKNKIAQDAQSYIKKGE